MYFGPFNTLKPDHTYHRICEPHQAEVFLAPPFHLKKRLAMSCRSWALLLCFVLNRWPGKSRRKSLSTANQNLGTFPPGNIHSWVDWMPLNFSFKPYQTYSTVPSRFHQIKRDMTVRKVNGPSLGKLNEMGLKKGTHMDLHSVSFSIHSMYTYDYLRTDKYTSRVLSCD